MYGDHNQCTIEIRLNLINKKVIRFVRKPTWFDSYDRCKTLLYKIPVTPKELGTAETVDAMVDLLVENINYHMYNSEDGDLFDGAPVFKKPQKGKALLKNTPANKFIAEILENISSMDQIEKITIAAKRKSALPLCNVSYTYNLKTGKYTGIQMGRAPEIFPLKLPNNCEMEYIDYVTADGVVVGVEKIKYFYNQPKIGIDVHNALIRKSVFLGRYEQDGISTNGPEDIEWIVLKVKNKRALVVSKYALDCKIYNNTTEVQQWGTLFIRKWLNTNFLQNAFSEEELAQIEPVITSPEADYVFVNSDNIVNNQNIDRIFLLSTKDVKEYSVGPCFATNYAKQMGARTKGVGLNGSENYVCWWLRDPYKAVSSVSRPESSEDYRGICVRPAMWINLEKTEIKLPISFECSKITQSDLDGFIIEGNTLKSYEGNDENVIIPSGVKNIGIKAFTGSSLKTITFSEEVKKIAGCAFDFCSSLSEIELPPLLKIIGQYTFRSCKSLKKVHIPNGVTKICQYAFGWCFALEKIAIPETVTTIQSCAFFCCKSLKDIYVPKSVVDIGKDAFDTNNKETVIHTTPGSYAETYAKENNIKVEYIE